MFSNIINFVGRILRSHCNHDLINLYDSGEYCPDCGKKIKLSWITIKCQKCRSNRIPKINGFGDITPLKKYCDKCGSDKWFSKKSDKIVLSETLYALPIKEIIEKKNEIYASSKTEVWVDEPVLKTTPKPRNNVIKANRTRWEKLKGR